MWFTETPWPPFVLCLVISAALFGWWNTHRGRGALAGSALFLLAGAAIVVIEAAIVTERERVEAGVYGLAKAFESGNAERCAEFFSPHDEADRELVRRAAGMVKIVGSIRISDLTVQVSSGNTRATAVFRASGTADFQGHSQHAATRWELTWERDGGEWKIVRVQRLRFMGEGTIEPFAAGD